MGKTPATVPAPTSMHANTTPADVQRNIRVVDAGTGKAIAKVISADSEAGKISRFDVDKNGDMVRVDNAFSIIEEDRAVRIEWIKPPIADADVNEAGAA